MAAQDSSKGTQQFLTVWVTLILVAYPSYLLASMAAWVGLLLLLLVPLGLALHIRHTFSIVSKLDDTAKHLSEGDLRHQLESANAGVFTKMIRSINRMAEDVSRTVLSLVETSDAMKSVAADIKSISDKAKAGVEEQERQTELAATAMTQMVSTVQEVAKSAENAANAAEKAHQSAKQGDALVSDIVIKISQVSEQVHQSRVVIERLANDSKNISSVIETISQVAEQTNLLALNAAIESARAGEHGRGFAVVADEVRSLAMRTSQATIDIQKQIATLQQGSVESVNVMVRSVTLADEAHTLVDEAQQLLVNIVSEVETITDMSHQIAAASEQQHSVAEEINKNINVMAGLALQNAKHTNSTNLSSLKVYNMSQEIGSLLKRFHVDPAAVAALDKHTAFVKWGPELDIGMPEVNRQHLRLVALINELHRTLNGNYGLEAVKRIVQGLVDYTANHFTYEEELFERFGYPQTKEHKEKHAKLVGQVIEFQRRVGRGEDVADELMAFLKSWLINHIQKSDKEYTHFMLSHGAE